MAIGHIGTIGGNLDKVILPIELSIQQQDRLIVSYLTLSVVILPATILVTQRPRGSKGSFLSTKDIDTMLQMQGQMMTQYIQIATTHPDQVEVHPGVGITNRDARQPSIEGITYSRFHTRRARPIMIRGMERTLGIIGRIDPVDDVFAPPEPAICAELQPAAVSKRMRILDTGGKRPRRFGFQRRVTLLIAGIVVEVGKRG